MDIRLPKKLKILSYYLPALYIVGGYVRNSLLNLPVSDIDLAAKYTVDEVTAALCNTEFKVANINKRLGTVKIYSCEDKKFSAEYTTFRIDSYPVGSGVHAPSDVTFTRDISLDAVRRDFTVNAVYYSIDTAEYLDFTGGIPDINRRVLKTTCDPEKVFSEDGLRLMRLVRLAAELNFEIDEATLSAAKKMSFMLKDISGERKRDELMKILTADVKYPLMNNHDAHLRGFMLLDDIGALKYVLPEMLEAKGVAQRPEYHVYDVFNHLVQTMYYCPPEIRLAGLLHDVGKPESIKKTGRMFIHGELGQQMAKKMLGRCGLKMSNREIDKICALIGTHMYDIDGMTAEKKLRVFIADHHEIIGDIINIKRADAKASRGSPEAVSVSADKIEQLYNVMLRDDTPLSAAELLIDGNDLEGCKIPVDKRAWAIRKVFEHAVAHADCRTRETQLQYLRGLSYGHD